MVINREILGGSKFGNAFSAPKLGAGRMAKGLMAGRSLPPVPYKLGLQLLLVSLELLSFGLHQAFMRLAPSSPNGVYKEFHAVCHVLSVFNPPVLLAISKNCWFCMVFLNLSGQFCGSCWSCWLDFTCWGSQKAAALHRQHLLVLAFLLFQVRQLPLEAVLSTQGLISARLSRENWYNGLT